MKKYFIIVYSILLITLPVLLHGEASNNKIPTQNKASDSPEELYKMIKIFGKVIDLVNKNYVDTIDSKTLIEGAIRGMLQSLDPHSKYLNSRELKESQKEIKGEFGGIGVQFIHQDGVVKIISPIDDSPAKKAGIKSNDIITHVNGKSLATLSEAEIVKLIQGKPKTKITLRVISGKQIKKVVLERALIKDNKVTYRIIDNSIYYIRIAMFNAQTQNGLDKAIKHLKSSLTLNDSKGLILDLRNNPGGLLSASVSVSDTFLTSGEILSIKGRLGKNNKPTDPSSFAEFNADRGDAIAGLPIIVLINGGTASAAEIVTGALQDHGRAIILGTKSFGKGIVQSTIPINELGAIMLTTSRYYTPSGRSIQLQGITPDIIVPAAKIEPYKLNNVTYEKDLKNVIKPKNKNNQHKKTTSKNKSSNNFSIQSKNLNNDFQLSQAISLLKSMQLIKDYNFNNSTENSN